jgi:hypothetical protein
MEKSDNYSNCKIGDKFGRLTILEKTIIKKRISFLCKCECGNTKIVNRNSLLKNLTKSCGCLQKERVLLANIIHNLSKTVEYKTWSRLKTRCYNKNNEKYKNYGGRGIKVCQRWLNSFENFLEDMGKRPEGRYSIDRIDVNGNYEPDNCRWATDLEQMNNTTTNKLITYKEKTQTLSQWARELNIDADIISQRLIRDKWSVEKALTQPIKNINNERNKVIRNIKK